MRRLVTTGIALALGATAVVGQNLDAIKKRREVMRAIATAGIANVKMMKGEAPFDLAKVQAALKMYQEEGAKLKNLFPSDSKKGGDTEASPKIWQAKSEFDAAIDALINAAKTGASTIKDEETLRSEYPKVARSCGGCHKDADGFSPRLSDSFKRLKQ